MSGCRGVAEPSTRRMAGVPRTAAAVLLFTNAGPKGQRAPLPRNRISRDHTGAGDMTMDMGRLSPFLSIGSCGEGRPRSGSAMIGTCDPGHSGGATGRSRRPAGERWIGLEKRRSPHRPPASTTGLEPRTTGGGCRAAARRSIRGKSARPVESCAPTGLEVYIMGFTRTDFGPRRIRAKFTGFDEVAIWKQIAAHRRLRMSVELQGAKDLVRAYYAQLDAARGEAVAEVMARYTIPGLVWRGYHPFNELNGGAAVAEMFWLPLKASLADMQRRQDIFMAGRNEIDGFKSVWVVSMGHLMGLLDAPWLGIRPSRKMTFLRYCEFNRVEEGSIAEAAMFFDIPHLMIQAGQNPFPPQTGAHMVQPGPMTHAGLMFDPQDPAEGKTTLAAIDHMIHDIRNWTGGREEPLVDELRRSWNEDMIWWGPAGIGATYTIERYAEQHSGPFRAGFRNRVFNGHICRLAEGCFGGFFRMAQSHAGSIRRVHGHARNRKVGRHAGDRHIPARRTKADRELDLYRSSAFLEPAGRGHPGPCYRNRGLTPANPQRSSSALLRPDPLPERGLQWRGAVLRERCRGGLQRLATASPNLLVGSRTTAAGPSGGPASPVRAPGPNRTDSGKNSRSPRQTGASAP